MSPFEEFEVLGFKVRFKPSSHDININPQEVIERVKQTAAEIKKSAPNLENAQVALLVALKMSSDQISLECDYRNDMEKLQTPVREVLNLIEEITPLNS